MGTNEVNLDNMADFLRHLRAKVSKELWDEFEPTIAALQLFAVTRDIGEMATCVREVVKRMAVLREKLVGQEGIADEMKMISEFIEKLPHDADLLEDLDSSLGFLHF